MANNANTRQRKNDKKKKDVAWLTKFRRDVDKVLSTGDLPSHYVGGGQAFTRGKENNNGESTP